VEIKILLYIEYKMQDIVIMESGGGTKIRKVIFYLTVSVDSLLVYFL